MKTNRKLLGNIRGPEGKAATIKVGHVYSVEVEESPVIENTGTESQAVFDFGIPRGYRGEAATIEAGTVTMLPYGANPVVENSGTPSDAVFNFELPEANGVKNMSQTAISDEDNGINEFTFRTADGVEAKFQVMNGSKGSKGNKGDKGDRGDSGITAPADGFFALAINEDGHLIVSINDDTLEVCPFSINENGNLIYTIGE